MHQQPVVRHAQRALHPAPGGQHGRAQTNEAVEAAVPLINLFPTGAIEQSVNIAQMAVGRPTNKPGGEAVGVLSLDSVPPAEA